MLYFKDIVLGLKGGIMHSRIVLLGASLLLSCYVINMSETFVSPQLQIADNTSQNQILDRSNIRHNKTDISDLNTPSVRHEEIDTQGTDKKPQQESFVDPYMIKDPPYNRRS